MKKLRQIPNLPVWIVALVFFLLALLPTYAYVRLIPAALAVIVGLYGLLALLARKKPGPARVLCCVLTTVLMVGVVLVSITGLCILRAGAAEPESPCDYIVVLGAQVRDSGPSRSLQESIDRDYEYLPETPDTVAIVTGGKGADEPISEAQCMFDQLVKMGIPPERIWMEDNATSTWENLKFSLDIIEERTGTRPASVGVVSSEYHLFRTAMQASRRGLEIHGISAKTTNPVRWLHYFVREIAGVWHYLILGGQYS